MEASKSINGYILEIDFTKLEPIAEKHRMTPRQLFEIFSDVHSVSEQHQSINKSQELLKDLVAHQQRMLDKWADGDDNVKNDLWKNLHNSGNSAKEYLMTIDFQKEYVFDGMAKEA